MANSASGKGVYLAFADESDHTAKNSFTAVGLTAIPASEVAAISKKISALRYECGAFCATDLLKFNLKSRPETCDKKTHEDLKTQCVTIAKDHGAFFIGYAYFNQAHKSNNPERNRAFGFNSVLQKLNQEMLERDSFAVAQIDRLDFSKKI
ncbi:hypothetical protein [Salipiger bermudensis]|uniref:hypothetical protein n=1 Tax=Salipiger bermudensis TaxID=344736 RepID=UPI001186B91C|nr:hypothetical protein [Salipiger bermudensis]